MTTSTTGAVPSGAASGRSKKRAAETNGKAKTVNFRGVKLILAPDNEVSDAVFTIAEDELSESLRVFLGADQYLKVQTKCRDDKLTIPQTVAGLRNLLSDIVSEYGLTPGE